MKLPTAKVARDTGLYVFGLLGIANEALIQEGDRPTLLVLFAAMVGLPAFIRSDEGRSKAKNGSSEPNKEGPEVAP